MISTPGSARLLAAWREGSRCGRSLSRSEAGPRTLPANCGDANLDSGRSARSGSSCASHDGDPKDRAMIPWCPRHRLASATITQSRSARACGPGSRTSTRGPSCTRSSPGSPTGRSSARLSASTWSRTPTTCANTRALSVAAARAGRAGHRDVRPARGRGDRGRALAA
jgi:hypothetical protein